MRTPRRHRLVLVALVAVAGVAGACSGGGSGPELEGAAGRGQDLARANGCPACHGSNGQGGVGPTWQGLFESEIELEDGSTVVADRDYLRRAIAEPDAEIHAGYSIRMPANGLTDDEIDDVVAYIEAL